MNKIFQYFVSGFAGGIFATLLLSWAYTYDTDTPLGSDAPSVIDNSIREVKDAIQERLNIDLYWSLTGSQVSDANTGKHKKVSLLDLSTTGDTCPPTQHSGEAHLFMVDDELWWQNDCNTMIQITESGYIEYQSITDVNSNTYILSVDNAGTGTANLIKADANDLATLPDGAVLEAATQAADGDRTIADKGYVDGQITAYTCFDANGSTVFETSMESASNFQDLDLSSYVGSNSALVFLEVKDSGNSDYNVKTKGYGSVFSAHVHASALSRGCGWINFDGSNEYGYAIVATDSNGVVQHGCTSSSHTITIKLIGFIR